MSKEKIIQKIKNDTEEEKNKIISHAENEAQEIITYAKQQASKESDQIIAKGKIQSETLQKLLLSKANQEKKRKILAVKESIIEECFIKAEKKLTSLHRDEYENIIRSLIAKGQKKIGSKCGVLVSGEIEKIMAQRMNVPVYGKIKSIGGIILQSQDGQINLDNTFDGIMAREKNRIRIMVGKLLFS